MKQWSSWSYEDKMNSVHFASPFWLGRMKSVPLAQDHFDRMILEWMHPEDEECRVAFTLDFVEASFTDRSLRNEMVNRASYAFNAHEKESLK